MIKLFHICTKLLLTLFFLVPLQAKSIDITDKDSNILDQVQIYIAKSSVGLKDIQQTDLFTNNNSKDINLGFLRDKTIWIKFSLHNNSDFPVSKILEVQNPLLEEVVLYDNTGESIKKGMLHITPLQTTIEPSFFITLDANTSETYYLKIFNHTTSLRCVLFLKDPNNFIYEDHLQQTLVMVSLGIILALFLYNFLLYIYGNEISYLYYCLYLATLVLQQLTYLGITPLFFPHSFVELDNLSVVLKVNAMYIAAALFAKEFLNTKEYNNINRIYNLIIATAIIEIPLFGTPWFYYPEVGILTGLVFVLFNMYAAIYIYKRGHKQARFFIAGWSILVVGFVLMIADGLGIVSIMYKLPNFILYATVLEALLLSLAFTDRYVLLNEEKELSDQLLVASLENRQAVIEAEIQKQTKDLSSALENKKTLLRELHHRTKNNLQLMLSIIRMQAETVEKSLKNKFQDLENRIAAISKTHEMLYIQKNLQEIDMYEYISELCEKIEQSFHLRNIVFQIEVKKIYLPFTEAGYVGLLINEIVINSIKHVNTEYLILHISMKREGDLYFLSVEDNGKEKIQSIDNDNSLGVVLIQSLVQDQLEGDYTMKTDNGVSYLIRFKL